MKNVYSTFSSIQTFMWLDLIKKQDIMSCNCNVRFDSHQGLNIELNETWNHGKRQHWWVNHGSQWRTGHRSRLLCFIESKCCGITRSVLCEPVISRSVPSLRFLVEFNSWDNYAEVWRILIILKAKRIFTVQLTPTLVSDGSLLFLNHCGCIFHSLWC